MTIGVSANTKEAVFQSGQNVPLQVVRWSEQRVAVTTSASSQRLTIPSGAKVIEITAIEDVYINFGDNTVDASSTIASDGSRIFAKGVQTVLVPLDSSGDPLTHVAVIQASAAGVFQVEQVS